MKHEITKPLKKRNKKIDGLTKITTLKSNSSKVYCAKCKTKRKIKKSKKTMKNGKITVKVICSVCGCKIFRVGKIKK